MQRNTRRLRTGLRIASRFLGASLLLPLCLVSAAATVGQPAPAFEGKDSQGRTQSLAQYRGKFVVLEWTNRDCPYTRKHYESGNMQRLQQEWTGKGVIWLTILSSAPGKQGYMTAQQENQYLQRMHAHPTAAILDPSGQIGRMYEAKTTPDMYVIDPNGTLIYQGAIDDKPTPDPSSIRSADNYLSDALAAAMQHRPVRPDTTQPYGCSVKYGE